MKDDSNLSECVASILQGYMVKKQESGGSILLKANLQRGRKLLIHGLLGALAGYFILHPASMLIHLWSEQQAAVSWDYVMLFFSSQHLGMAVFFTLLGMAFGLSFGLYNLKIVTLYEKLKLLSVTDELTSLHNRRYFFQKLREEIERAWRYSRKISLLLIDIDNFKQYNDIYGHQQGDDVLRTFSNRLKKIVRENDTVARLGGEEFVIIMPEANSDMAFNLAERLRLDVTKYPLRDANGKFTISIGVAGFPSDAQDTNKLLRKADSALYQAKREGKNKVCLYNNISLDEQTAKS